MAAPVVSAVYLEHEVPVGSFDNWDGGNYTIELGQTIATRLRVDTTGAADVTPCTTLIEYSKDEGENWTTGFSQSSTFFADASFPYDFEPPTAGRWLVRGSFTYDPGTGDETFTDSFYIRIKEFAEIEGTATTSWTEDQGTATSHTEDEGTATSWTEDEGTATSHTEDTGTDTSWNER